MRIYHHNTCSFKQNFIFFSSRYHPQLLCNVKFCTRINIHVDVPPIRCRPCPQPPPSNKQCTLWSSENDHKLLITGQGLNCHLFEYGKMDVKFKLLVDTLRVLGIDFTPRTVQAKFEKLLKEACEEMHLDLTCMGFEKVCSEAEEEATRMAEEADNWVHIQEVSFYLGFFTC